MVFLFSGASRENNATGRRAFIVACVLACVRGRARVLYIFIHFEIGLFHTEYYGFCYGFVLYLGGVCVCFDDIMSLLTVGIFPERFYCVFGGLLGRAGFQP